MDTIIVKHYCAILANISIVIVIIVSLFPFEERQQLELE